MTIHNKFFKTIMEQKVQLTVPLKYCSVSLVVGTVIVPYHYVLRGMLG